MADISWISTTSGNWYDAANWDTGSNGLGGADIGNVNITLANDNPFVNGSFE